jgi:hypothetical protein
VVISSKCEFIIAVTINIFVRIRLFSNHGLSCIGHLPLRAILIHYLLLRGCFLLEDFTNGVQELSIVLALLHLNFKSGILRGFFANFGEGFILFRFGLFKVFLFTSLFRLVNSSLWLEFLQFPLFSKINHFKL